MPKQRTIVKGFTKLEVVKRVQQMEKEGWEPAGQIGLEKAVLGENKHYIVMEREIDELTAKKGWN